MKRNTKSLGDVLTAIGDQFNSVTTEAGKIARLTGDKAKSLNTDYQLRAKANSAANQTLIWAQNTYGEVRSKIWKRGAARDQRDLLEATRDELLYVMACIMQTDRKGAMEWSDRLGRAVASKLAAAGVTTTFLGLVATFGTAGTGVSISGLSGAAATSATLAWVGGLIGGGMVAGTFLTGGFGLAVGYATYRAIKSRRRPFEEFSPVEQGIVSTCGVLVSAMNEVLNPERSRELKIEEMELIYRNMLEPLNQSLQENCDQISRVLDVKNSVAFRQHAIKDFQRTVMDGFSKLIDANHRYLVRNSESYIEYVVGGVLYGLLRRSAVGDDEESQLVLQAIRRSDNTLTNASQEEIADKLSGYLPEELKGVANNVKGIYHELVYVRQYNETNADTYAELYGATNHPGADIQIRDQGTGELLKEIQLKATDNPSYIATHQQRYPDIEVFATTEVTVDSDAQSSGILNKEIEQQVAGDIDILANNTEIDQMLESGSLAGLVATGRNLVDVLQGRKGISDSTKSIVESMTVSSASTGLAAFLFS